MIYRDFCANQNAALDTLQRLCDNQPDLRLFVESCERLMRAQAMPLASYFLKPVQRLSMYRLLLDKVR